MQVQDLLSFQIEILEDHAHLHRFNGGFHNRADVLLVELLLLGLFLIGSEGDHPQIVLEMLSHLECFVLD